MEVESWRKLADDLAHEFEMAPKHRVWRAWNIFVECSGFAALTYEAEEGVRQAKSGGDEDASPVRPIHGWVSGRGSESHKRKCRDLEEGESIVFILDFGRLTQPVLAV